MEATMDEGASDGNWIAYRIKSGEIIYYVNEETKECRWPSVDSDGSSSNTETKPVCCDCVIKIEGDRNIWDHVSNLEEANRHCASTTGKSNYSCSATNETATDSSIVDDLGVDLTEKAAYAEDHCHIMPTCQVPKDVTKKQLEKSRIEVEHSLSENTSNNEGTLGTVEREGSRLSAEDNPVVTARVRRLKERVQAANSKHDFSPVTKNVQRTSGGQEYERNLTCQVAEKTRKALEGKTGFVLKRDTDPESTIEKQLYKTIVSPQEKEKDLEEKSEEKDARYISAETVASTLQDVLQDRPSAETRINSNETGKKTRLKFQFLEETYTHKPKGKDSIAMTYEAALASLLDDVQQRLSQETDSAGGADTILESEKDLKSQSLCNTLVLASEELYSPLERNNGQASFVEQDGNSCHAAECMRENTLAEEGAQRDKAEEPNREGEERCTQAMEMNIDYPEDIHTVLTTVEDIEPESDLTLPSPEVVHSHVKRTTKRRKNNPKQRPRRISLSVSSMGDSTLKALKEKMMPCRVHLVDMLKKYNVKTSKHRKQRLPNELLLGNFPLLDCTRIRMQPLDDMNCDKSYAGSSDVVNIAASSPVKITTGTDEDPSSCPTRVVIRAVDRVVTSSVKVSTATSDISVSNPARETTGTIGGHTSSSSRTITGAAASALSSQVQETTGTTDSILSSSIIATTASIDSSLGAPARGTTASIDNATSCPPKLTIGTIDSPFSAPAKSTTRTIAGSLNPPARRETRIQSKPSHKKKKRKRDQGSSNLATEMPAAVNQLVHDRKKAVCFSVASRTIEDNRQQRAESVVRQSEKSGSEDGDSNMVNEGSDVASSVGTIYSKEGENLNPSTEITYPDSDPSDIVSTISEGEKPREPPHNHATENPASGSCKSHEKLIYNIQEQTKIQTESASTKSASSSFQRHCPTCHCSGNFERHSLPSVSTQTESDQGNKGISEPTIRPQGMQSKSISELRDNSNSFTTTQAGSNVNTDASLDNLEVLSQVASFFVGSPSDRPGVEAAKHQHHLPSSSGVAPAATTTTYRPTNGVCTFSSKCSTQPGSRSVQLSAIKQQQYLLASLGIQSVPKTILSPAPNGRTQVGFNTVSGSSKGGCCIEANKNFHKLNASRVSKTGRHVLSKSGNQPNSTGLQFAAKQQQTFKDNLEILSVSKAATYPAAKGQKVCSITMPNSTQHPPAPGPNRLAYRPNASVPIKHIRGSPTRSDLPVVTATASGPVTEGLVKVSNSTVYTAEPPDTLLETNKDRNTNHASATLMTVTRGDTACLSSSYLVSKAHIRSVSTVSHSGAQQMEEDTICSPNASTTHQSSAEPTDYNSKTNEETNDAVSDDATKPYEDTNYSQCASLVRHYSRDHTYSKSGKSTDRTRVGTAKKISVSKQRRDNNFKGKTMAALIPDDCKAEAGMEVNGVLVRVNLPDIVNETNCINDRHGSKDKNQAGLKSDIAVDGNEDRPFEITSLQDGSTASVPLSHEELKATFTVVGRQDMHGESEAGQNTSTTKHLHEFVEENQCNPERTIHQDANKQNSFSLEQVKETVERSSNNHASDSSQVTGAKSGKRKRDAASRKKETSQNKVVKASVTTKKDKRPRSQKGFKCEFCKKVLEYATHFVRHLRTHTGEKPYQCELCGNEFSEKGSLDRHQRSHKDTVTHVCKYCDETFTDREIYKQHLKSHTRAPTFKCDKCGKEFKRLCTLNEHKVSHAERSYKCRSCSKKFLHALSLERHLQAHKAVTTKKKTVDCTFCNKSFRRRDSLTRHLRIHSGEKPFECQFCNKKFVDWSGRQVHVRRHTGEKPYECDICKKAFAQSSMLTIHRRSHSGEKPYKCQTCSLAFATSGNLRKHTMIHTREKPFPCEFCGRRFQRAFDLTRHQQGRDHRSGSCPALPDLGHQLKLRTVSPEIENDSDATHSDQTVQSKSKPRVICSTHLNEVISGGISDPLENNKRNDNTTNGDSVAAPVPQQPTAVTVQVSETPAQIVEELRFTAVQQSAVESQCPSEVENHVSLHLNEANCGKGKESEKGPRYVTPMRPLPAPCETDKRKTVKFAPEETLNNNTPGKASFHSVREVEAEFYPKMGKYGYDKQLICKFCRRMFESKEALQEHAPVHVAPRKYHCKYCEKTFTHCTSLNQHLSRHLPEKKHECQFCKKRFSVTGDLKRHLLTHTGVKPFKCNVCPKAFSQRGNLSSHLRLHDGNRSFPCDLCDKKFYQSTHLSQHRRIHTGEKPYHCSLCDKSFPRGAHLQRHLRTHTGEKPYKCEYCDRRFIDRSTRCTHQRKHTGEKPFECQTCGKRFPQSSQLKFHVRSHTKYKPYKCNHCNKTFATPGARAKHTRLHFGKRPFRCEFCNWGFATSEGIVKHMKYHEKEKT